MKGPLVNTFLLIIPKFFLKTHIFMKKEGVCEDFIIVGIIAGGL
jgi:hypothetical protein